MLDFTETVEPAKVLRLLARGVPYYLKSWCDVNDDAGIFGRIDPSSFNMRSVGSSSPVIEYVVRPHVTVLCVLGSFLHLNKSDMFGAVIPMDELASKLRKGVRWACETHLTGTLDVEVFLERKRWGENWRSSLWATLLGCCGVFCRSVLDDELQRKINAVVAFEADRFIGVSPPCGCEIDTKVEENAIDAMALAWAINRCPDHPHVNEWERALQLWSVNCGSTVHDRADHTAFLGHSLSRAVTTQNLFPDMTAENHGFFNPDVLSYGAWVVLAMAAYSLHKRAPPEWLLRKSHQRTFDLLLRFCLPNGMVYAPGSHDFPLFLPRPFAYAWGLWNNNARARTLTARILSWMDALCPDLKGEDGPWVLGLGQRHDGWELLFQSAVGLELALLACMPFQENRPTVVAAQAENVVDTRHIYPYVEVCYRRNIRTTRSMAWKALGGHPVVGFAVHSQPELLLPVKAGMLGIPHVGSHTQSWDVAFHHDRLVRDGFDTYGRVRYFGDAGEPLLHRDVRVFTWGDEGLVVLDEIIADTPVTVFEQYLSPVSLVNDRWTGDCIDVYSGSLHETFHAGQRTSGVVQCPSFWASIGTHLLFQFIWGRSKGLYYIPARERNSPSLWKNGRLDTLAVHVEPQNATAGAVVYRVGFFIGTGKGPRPFKSAGMAREFFKGLVIMDGKMTMGLD